jgi:ribosome-associated protein
LRLNKIQQAAVTALEDIKATDIVPLDTRTLTSLYDAIVVATAESGRQTKALARNVADKVKAAGGHVIAIEGENSGEWVLVDCGELVVHIMLPQMRSLYNLEELWTPSPAVKGPRAPKTVIKKPVGSATKPRETGAKTKSVGTGSRAKPVTKPPAAKPAAKKPASKRPAVKKPAVKKPAAKKPATKPTATKKPAAKKPATKRPAAKKPAAKKRRA